MELDLVEITGLFEEIRRFYSYVGDESRYMRFLAAVRDPASVYKHLWSCGGRSFLVLEGRRPVAIVDVTPCGEEAEAGIVVADALQGRGYGTRIAEIFASLLPRLGFWRVKAEIYRENIKALALAKRMGAEIDCSTIVCVVRLQLATRSRAQGPLLAVI